MVDVTDGADVHMRLIALEFLLAISFRFAFQKWVCSVWSGCFSVVALRGRVLCPACGRTWEI